MLFYFTSTSSILSQEIILNINIKTKHTPSMCFPLHLSAVYWVTWIFSISILNPNVNKTCVLFYSCLLVIGTHCMDRIDCFNSVQISYYLQLVFDNQVGIFRSKVKLCIPKQQNHNFLAVITRTLSFHINEVYSVTSLEVYTHK